MWPELEHLEASNFYMPQVIDRAIKQCALTCFALIYWNCIVSCLFLLVNTCLPQEWTCYFQLKNMLQLTIMLFFKGCRIVFGFFFASGFVFFLVFFPGTICLVFATVWNKNLSFCMVFATFWHGHFAFCMAFATFGHVCFPFCMVCVIFWHFNLWFAWYLLHFGPSTVHVGLLRVL